MSDEEMVEYMDLMYHLDTDYDVIQGCNHSWKKYEGFTEVYDYCIHCDLKTESDK